MQVTSVTRRIEKAILELNGGEFTASQIAEKTGLKKNLVRSIFYTKVREGSVEIVSDETIYRHNGKKISESLPCAFVAEKVWSTLISADRPLTLRDITTGAETLAGDKNLNLYGATSRLLSIWFHKSGTLERTGRGYKNDPYEYLVKAGITERPVANR